MGALNSATTMVLAYYFGSSVGSKQKSNEINDILERKEPKSMKGILVTNTINLLQAKATQHKLNIKLY